MVKGVKSLSDLTFSLAYDIIKGGFIWEKY